MQKINSFVTQTSTTDNLGPIIKDPSNVFNQVLGSLPTIPETTTTDTILGTDGLPGTDIVHPPSTDIVVPELPTNASSLNYEVWAATWNRQVHEDAISVVPFVYVDNMGEWTPTPGDDYFVNTTQYNNFKTALEAIPEGRRVVQPTFWSAAPANWTWSSLDMIDYYIDLDGTEIGGRKLIWTPWQENVIADAKTSIIQFLTRCSNDGLVIDHISDNTFYGDGGQPGIWNLSMPPRYTTHNIYVSDSIGNDAWTGETSVVSGTIGPVKTIAKAALLAKTYTAAGGDSNIEIRIAGGTYRMLGTDANPILYMNSTYSAKDGRTLTFKPKSASDEVIITGSEAIPHTAFTMVNSSDPKWSRISAAARGNVYVADISSFDIGPGYPSMWKGDGVGSQVGYTSDLPALPDLIFNNETMVVARWPNKINTNGSGFSLAECTTIETVVDTGTAGVWSVDRTYLTGIGDTTPDPCGEYTPAGARTTDANNDGIADCFRNGVFTYSSEYDSVISTWTSAAINDGIYLYGSWRWDWSQENYKVVSLDTVNRRITVNSRKSNYGIQNYTLCDAITGIENCPTNPTCGSYLSNPTPRRWYALNILEELDSPGEYFIDRDNEKLYFWPKSALNSNSSIRLTHRAVAGAGVKSNDTTENGFAPNGTISRIDFPYPGWEDTPVGWTANGAAVQSRHIWNVKGGLRSLFKLYGAKNIRFEGLTFRDSAGSGIEIQLCENITVLKCKIYNIKKHAINAPGGKNVTIDSCIIHDIGLGAIINTGGNKQTLEPANKIVTRCSIKRFGKLLDTSVAIRIEGVGNTVSYNLISEGPSGVWASLGNDIIIEYNHFYKLCKNNDDAGAVYAGRNASSFNIVVRNNFFNDIGPDQDGGFIYGSFNAGCAGGRPPNTRPVTDADKRVQGVIGVYFDDLLSGNTISENVFYKCGRGDWGGGIGMNGGINHKIENNIFVECPSGYGDIINAKKVWNASLSGQAFYVINNEGYEWYESGGPLDRFGKTSAVTGYSPWTMPFGPTAYPSADFNGVMAVSDIRDPVYKNRAPWLHEIYNFSNLNVGTAGTITVNVAKATLYKTQAINNVFVNCTKISHSGVVGSDPLDPSVIGGFIVDGQFESTNMSYFANVPAFDFTLTQQALSEIRQVIPAFSNIPFQSIPTINYVPESYTQQTWQTCAVGNGHYSCEREFSDPDALEAIVTDPRFNTTINTVNGKTFYTDFMDRYNLCKTEIDTRQRSLFSIYSNDWYVATATTAAQALSPMYGYLGDTQNPQNNMQVFPWGNSNAQAATRAWTDTVVDWGDAFYRPTMWTQALSSTGYNNVSLTQDYSYPLNNEEFKYFDNGYGWKGSPKIAKSDTNVSPPFYGELTPNALGTFSYIINPTTDDERYLFSSIDPNSTPPATTLRYSSPTWLAFLLDMRLMKAIHRSDDTAWQRFAPWIISTDVGGDVDRYRYGPLTGDVGKQYWKEIILHSCLHGAKFINYFNGVSPENPQSTLDMHNVLEEWRVASGNSRAQPTDVNRIAVNSSVIISGGRLLSTNQYLWRITAKPSASVTLRAFGPSTSRTDIPQTITLDSASRGAWLTTTTSVPPVYILDENTQQETTQFTYVTLLRNTVTQGLIAREHAIFGGATHDFGSGVGFDVNGKSIGGLQYMTDAGIESSGHHSGNVNWYYKNNYRLNDDGNLIPVIIDYAPGLAQRLCDQDPCYSGQGCYQAPPLHAAEWIEQMSKTGEWGAPLRPEQPFPNSTSYYASANQRNTWFPYVILEDGTTIKIHAPFDNTKGKDTPMEFMVSDKISGTVPDPQGGPEIPIYNSFWQRDRAQGGRADLAYEYRLTANISDYSSVATGWSNVVFYTLADGTLKWQTASSTYAGYPILPPDNLAVLKYKQIAVGYGSVIGLKTDGTVVGWGGVGGEVERSTAFFQQQVTFKGRTIKKVAAGAGHYIALLDDGQAVTWGSNESAQCSDPDTVWTPIGLIPIPTATNKEYITNHIPYQDFFYDQQKSSLMYTFDDTTDGGTDGIPMSNSCVPVPQNRHYRLFRNNLLGCPFHSNNEYTGDNPPGGYDTPYVITGETYPIQQGGSFAWSGKINWADQTGAPNDYQFSRNTTKEDTGVNSSFGSSGWRRALENIPMKQASGETAIGYQNSAANGGTLVFNSVFGTAFNKYVDIAAGRAHSLLLTESGNIETWGQNWYYTITGSGHAPVDPDTGENLGWGRVGQPGGSGTGTDIPHGYGTYFEVRRLKRTPNTVKAIATGYYTSQIIKPDGSIFAWDRNEWGESLPYLNSDGTEGLPAGPFKQVNGGYHHTCALRENGTVVCWGENTEGECNVPSDLGQCLWIDAGARFTLALKRNGELWAWGKVSLLKPGATDGVAIKLVNDTIIIPNLSTGLLPGHEYPMIVSGAKEIRSASDGLPTKYEPGNMWKYNGFIFAPIREDDGCADALFMSTYTKVLESSKANEEYSYKIMHSPTVPPCITQGNAWKTWSDDDFVNGEYRPKRVFVNFEDQLVDQIRGLDMTARFGPGQYGGMGGVLVNAKIWQKVVSYVKLTRKMNNKIREVWGSQANINHYDMMAFPYYQNWKSGWYPTAGPLMWGELDLLENTADNQSRVSTCPYCDELDIGYPGDAVFNQLSFEEKRELNIKALKAVQKKVFALAAAIAKMCLFEPAEGEPDVLDLRPEMSVLMPQIDSSNFIITGLNHYPNSAHGDLVNNAHKYYAATSDGFTVGGETLMNNSEGNKSRQMSVHHKEQGRIGLFNNQSSGKLYSFMVQGVCGSQVAPSGYEFYNSSDPANAGYKKSFNYPCNTNLSTCIRPTFNGVEVSSFPISESVANHQAGDRKYVVPTFPQNTNRKSFLRHSVWVNLWNDFLVRTQLGSALKNKDEIIWSDNNLQSVVSSYFPNEVSAPPGYNNQLRPCAQGETPHAGCRDIVTNPYILPTPMNDSSRIRNNSFSTFNC